MDKTLIIRTVNEYRQIRQDWYKQGLTVGLVPTMGALHEGHAALARVARKQCQRTVASIFVNPAQFAPHEDLNKYPRTEQSDHALLQQEGTDIVFAPTVTELYPQGIPLDVGRQKGAFVEYLGKSHQMEGSIRPHFFRGVCTVLCKLFNIIQPTHAYFGQKDIQQCCVTKSLVKDLFYPIDIQVVETVRERDGLAMSSRNRFLNRQERRWAPTLYNALKHGQDVFRIRSTKSPEIIAAANRVILQEPNVKLEYLSLVDPNTLEPVHVVDPAVGAIFSGAIRVGNTRIIDNLLLGIPTSKL